MNHYELEHKHHVEIISDLNKISNAIWFLNATLVISAIYFAYWLEK